MGYSYRFSQAVRITEEVLETGILGHIHQVRAHGGCSLSEAATSHLNQPDDIGGAFFVIGCHLVDLLIHHLGMPASVNAKIPKFAGLFGPGSREDAGIALFEYSNKIVSFDFQLLGSSTLGGKLGRSLLRKRRHAAYEAVASDL